MEKDDGMRKSGGSEKSFGFPLNIKQMGNVDRELKIYIEDYAYTYLYRYAKTHGKTEKLAVLAGRYYRIDGQDTVVISGAIQGKYTVKENGNEIFTDETWKYVSEQMEKYFSDLSIVGWVRIQPEYGTFMMAKDEIFHKECFKNKWQVFFVIDPAEMQDCAYALNEGKTSMRRVKGYFIYYDKNESMQDYMIENSLSEPKGECVESDEAETDLSGKKAVYRLLGMTGRKSESNDKKEEYVPDRIDAAAKIRSVLNKKEEKKKERQDRSLAIGTVCAVLSAACIVMCFGIIKGQNRIRYLEEEMYTMKNSYTAIAERLENTAQQVFAVQNAEKNDYAEKVEEIKNEEKTEDKKYTVEEGDSLWYICRKFYGGENKIEEIKAFNQIEDENKLYVGQTIKLP